MKNKIMKIAGLCVVGAIALTGCFGSSDTTETETTTESGEEVTEETSAE